MHHRSFIARRTSSSNYLKSSKLNNSSGVSLIETLLVVAIIALAILAGFLVYSKQLGRAQDGKRKSELHDLRQILEEFYNDHRCYPRPTEICYDAATNEDNPCHICGSEADPVDGEKISIYNLPCNPDHPEEQYLYEAEDSACPSWYRVFTKLFDVDNTGPCPHSLCGPSGGYDYAVTSSNVPPLQIDELYSISSYPDSPACAICGTLEQCEQGLSNGYYFLGLYKSESHCCDENPNATNCNWIVWDELDCANCSGSLSYCRNTLGYETFHDGIGITALERCCAIYPGVASCN